MEKQTEALERISARVQWLDEESSRQIREDQEGWELQARQIDERLATLERYEPVDNRMKLVESKMKEQERSLESIYRRLERVQQLKGRMDALDNRKMDAAVDLEAREEESRIVAAPPSSSSLAFGSPAHEALLLGLRDQVSESVDMLERYLSRAEELEVDKDRGRDVERARFETSQQRMCRSLANRCAILEKKLGSLESSVVEEHETSLNALKVILRSVRNRKRRSAV